MARKGKGGIKEKEKEGVCLVVRLSFLLFVVQFFSILLCLFLFILFIASPSSFPVIVFEANICSIFSVSFAFLLLFVFCFIVSHCSFLSEIRIRCSVVMLAMCGIRLSVWYIWQGNETGKEKERNRSAQGNIISLIDLKLAPVKLVNSAIPSSVFPSWCHFLTICRCFISTSYCCELLPHTIL